MCLLSAVSCSVSAACVPIYARQMAWQAIAQQSQGLAAAAAERQRQRHNHLLKPATAYCSDNNPSPCGSTIVILSRFLPSMTPPYTTMATPEQNFWYDSQGHSSSRRRRGFTRQYRTHDSRPRPCSTCGGTRDGTLIEVDITSHSLTFAGRPARLVLAHDVTERRRAITALAERTRSLEAVRGVAGGRPGVGPEYAVTPHPRACCRSPGSHRGCHLALGRGAAGSHAACPSRARSTSSKRP